MIHRFEAVNYRCLKKVVIDNLTPLHAFVGPNDSGKSTILRAMLAPFTGRDFRPGVAPWMVTLGLENGSQLAVGAPQAYRPSNVHTIMVGENDTWVAETGSADLRRSQGAELLRLEPDAMRKATSLLPDDRLREQSLDLITPHSSDEPAPNNNPAVRLAPL